MCCLNLFVLPTSWTRRLSHGHASCLDSASNLTIEKLLECDVGPACQLVAFSTLPRPAWRLIVIYYVMQPGKAIGYNLRHDIICDKLDLMWTKTVDRFTLGISLYSLFLIISAVVKHWPVDQEVSVQIPPTAKINFCHVLALPVYAAHLVKWVLAFSGQGPLQGWNLKYRSMSIGDWL